MRNALEGITVVAVEQAVAAPYASSRLADAGARVIQSRTPWATSREITISSFAVKVHISSGSIAEKNPFALTLTVEQDRAVLEAIVAQADVFIQNLKPGSVRKLGFGSADLRKRHPRLITCDISGFGDGGALSHLKAYDLIVQAETGLCAITGTAQGPARVGMSVCDIAAGMTALNAILQALLQRERSGEGSAIHVSLFDAIADWMNVPVLQFDYSGYHTARGRESSVSSALWRLPLCGRKGHHLLRSK